MIAAGRWIALGDVQSDLSSIGHCGAEILYSSREKGDLLGSLSTCHPEKSIGKIHSLF